MMETKRIKIKAVKETDDLNVFEFEDEHGEKYIIDTRSIDLLAMKAGLGGEPEVV